jgi:site-specific DNA-cytosine methylase
VVDGRGDSIRPQDFIIEAENFGVPQMRHRVILFGVRRDLSWLDHDVLSPAMTGRVSVWQAISGLWLFTAGKGSPSLLQEIRRELASADQVDILVSFITVSGVRKLQDVLQQITATGAQGQSATRLRILTTTYTGATEARALDELARLPAARFACRSTAAAHACMPRPGCSSARPASARPMWAAPICRARR